MLHFLTQFLQKTGFLGGDELRSPLTYGKGAIAQRLDTKSFSLAVSLREWREEGTAFVAESTEIAQPVFGLAANISQVLNFN